MVWAPLLVALVRLPELAELLRLAVVQVRLAELLRLAAAVFSPLPHRGQRWSRR